ncbi:MAG: S41 family peptidase [Desulfomonile tiedjei]|nr:S41 family peptidase [Desulfomonile tiedjei]
MVTLKHVKLSFIIIIALALFWAGPVAYAETQSKSPDYKELKLFRQVMGIVQKNYVKEVADKDLVQGAINGMLQSLDAHSSFLTEDMFKELQVETKGEFGGLGIEITLESGVLTVVSPIEDTPAFKAGVKPGDKIIKINGESTKNITLLKAVKMMRGPKGSKVTITIMREGWRKFKDFNIVRDIIHVHSVKKETLESGYPYVKVVNFQESTDNDLVSAVKELGGDDSIKGMVLDLRNNPGGLLDQAVKVANLFVDKGLIVYTDGRVKDQRMEFRATRTGKHYKFKVAVLINEGSASASEIVAGALQDHDRGVIFGTKSFGKASVQTIIPLENGSGLRLTTAYYYTPKGRHIQKTGIVPDVDMKEEVQKQQDEEAEEDAKPEAKKQKKSRTLQQKVDPENDLVLRRALTWLKSDVSVKQYKMEQQKPIPDTAWYNK